MLGTPYCQSFANMHVNKAVQTKLCKRRYSAPLVLAPGIGKSGRGCRAIQALAPPVVPALARFQFLSIHHPRSCELLLSPQPAPHVTFPHFPLEPFRFFPNPFTQASPRAHHFPIHFPPNQDFKGAAILVIPWSRMPTQGNAGSLLGGEALG